MTNFDKHVQIENPSGPVGQSALTGTWFIRMGYANFNSRANNGSGYTTKEAAEKAIRKLDPQMRDLLA